MADSVPKSRSIILLFFPFLSPFFLSLAFPVPPSYFPVITFLIPPEEYLPYFFAFSCFEILFSYITRLLFA
jgi:hypothetical protein